MFWRSMAATFSAAGLVAATMLGPVAADAGAIFHKPRIPSHSAATASNVGWASSNWSGYAKTGTGFTTITGTWTVPAAASTRTATFSSNWIGIDGFNNSSLIQTGTESDYYNHSAHYTVWWEILPAAETPIASMSVSPGDTVTASITHQSGSTWVISIKDLKTGKSFTTSQSYTGPQTSAEWIEEAPTVGGRIAPLAHYGSSTFDPGTVNGGNPGLKASDGGAMIQNRVQVSTPSLPDTDTDGFTMAYGSSTPTAPKS